MNSPLSHMLDQSPLLRIGWVGVGVMGVPMCQHLLRAGYDLTVYTRTPSKAQALLDQGARWAKSAGALVAETDVVCSMVGFPTEVRCVYLHPDGMLSLARANQVFVDFTTSEPGLARELVAVASSKGAISLDAPVSGGEVGARNGTLTIMVGGNVKAYEAIKPMLSVFSQTIIHQGESGCGQHAKLCNQITIAGTMIGVCEALVYAFHAGLDGESLLRSIRKGAAGCWTLDNLAPRMLKRDFAAGFFVEHFIKDMGIALEEANRMGLILPGLSLVRELYLTIQSRGHKRSGTHVLLLALEDMAPSFLQNSSDRKSQRA